MLCFATRLDTVIRKGLGGKGCGGCIDIMHGQSLDTMAGNGGSYH